MDPPPPPPSPVEFLILFNIFLTWLLISGFSSFLSRSPSKESRREDSWNFFRESLKDSSAAASKGVSTCHWGWRIRQAAILVK